MIRSLITTFTLAGFARPIQASLVYDHTTYGGVDHYVLGVGHSGKLLAVYTAIAYRGTLSLQCPISRDHDAPGVVTSAAIASFATAFDVDWTRPVAGREVA